MTFGYETISFERVIRYFKVYFPKGGCILGNLKELQNERKFFILESKLSEQDWNVKITRDNKKKIIKALKLRTRYEIKNNYRKDHG